MSMFKSLSGTLSSDVATNGTVTLAYPARTSPELASSNTDEGSFYLAMGHRLVFQNGGATLVYPKDFDLTFGTSSITLTNKQSSTWKAGTSWRLDLNEPGDAVYGEKEPEKYERQRMARMSKMLITEIDLGAPDAAVSNGICASQSISTTATLDGSLVVSGKAVFDVPRAVVGAWTGTAVATVTGTDEYGNTVVESSASGTTMTGKKAFKTVTKIQVSGAVTLATFGTGDVLGLPVFLPASGYVLKELQDGAAATAGTIVAGIRTAGGSTATTGDVRGTYDPNAACDGDKVFKLIVALNEPGYRGIAQYAG